MGTNCKLSSDRGVTKLLYDMELLLLESKSADTVFFIGIKETPIPCHSFLLRQRCKNYRSDSQRLPSTSPELFQLFLNYIYTGKLTIEESNLLDLLCLANDFGMDDLESTCEELIYSSLDSSPTKACTLLTKTLLKKKKLSSCSSSINSSSSTLMMNGNVVSNNNNNINGIGNNYHNNNSNSISSSFSNNSAITSTSNNHKNVNNNNSNNIIKSFQSIISHCTKLIGENPGELFQSSKFLSIPMETLIAIISSDQLCLEEEQIWRYVLKWAQFNANVDTALTKWTEEDRLKVAKYLTPVISYVRLLLIDSRIFAEEVEPTGCVPMALSLERYRFAALSQQAAIFSSQQQKQHSSSNNLHNGSLNPNTNLTTINNTTGGGGILVQQQPTQLPIMSAVIAPTTTLEHTNNLITTTTSSSIIPASSSTASTLSRLIPRNSPKLFQSSIIIQKPALAKKLNEWYIQEMGLISSSGHGQDKNLMTDNNDSLANNKPSSSSIIKKTTDSNNQEMLSNNNSNNSNRNTNSNNKTSSWRCIYRASLHGFSADSFHKHCDGHSPTFIIAQIGNTKSICGGFTDIPWKRSKIPRYSTSSKSFLFSFNPSETDNAEPIKYKVIKKHFAVCHYEESGPIFGAGADLYISSNCDMSNESYSNLSHSYEYIDESSLKNANNHNNCNLNGQLIQAQASSSTSSNNASSSSLFSLAPSYNFLISDYEVFVPILENDQHN